MRKIMMLSLCFLLTISQLWAQNRTIKGKVLNEKGEALAGVTVTVKGSTTGTATGTDGTFTLSVPPTAKTLVVSSLNYVAQDVNVVGKTSISVLLVSTASELEGVVVQVPYGTVKKKAFTGAENTIGAATLSRQQVTNVTKAIDGLIPGVQVTNGGGAPGSGADIRIRGIGSINASSSPLYVLNGFPYDGSISSISPDDIESLTVLKDAAASALYGSRAANGVIMITTKKGARGRSTVSATINQGYETRGIPEYDRVGPQAYYELFWEGIRNGFLTGGDSYASAGTKASAQLTDASHLVYNAYNVPGTSLVDATTGKLNPNASLLWTDNWADALFQVAQRTNANINFAGGSDKSDYFLSVGYLNEEGTAKYSYYKRYNFRLNVNAAATSWLNTGLNIDGAMSRNQNVPNGGTATTNPFYYSRQMGPIYPVYQYGPTGNTFIDSVGDKKLDWGVPSQMGTRPYAGNSNLVGSLALDDRHSDIINANANTFAEVKFLNDFSFKTSFGINIWDNNSTTYQNNQFADAQSVRGRSTKSNGRQISLTLNEVLSWKRNFGKHGLAALAGHENYKYKYNSLSLTRTGFQYPGQTELDNATLTESTGGSYEDNQTLESYFSNVNYNFDQKYLVSGSVRTDGSSRFSPGARWGTFYSVGLGYRVSQEKFMKNVKWVNDLKLRASYGEQGNENIGLYYQYANYFYANGTGNFVAYTRPANADLAWEKNKATDFGVDAVLFNNRLQVTIDYFNKVSDNLLFDVPLALSTAFPTAYQNVGSMRNYGWEFAFGYNAVRKKDFDWRVDLNFSTYKNEITKLPPAQQKTGIISGTKKLMEGKSIYDFWLREFAGVDAATGEAMYYRDVLGTDGNPTGQRVLTNTIANASYYYVGGSALPKISGGITNSFRYRNFDLSVLATFAYGGKFYDGNYAGIMHSGSYGIAWQTDILNRWQKPGDVTNVPKLNTSTLATQDGTSSRFLFDASYFNIKNISLGYSLSTKDAQKLHLSGLKFTATIDNAWLFTAKSGMDPQRSFAGTSDATYPIYRIISVGVNVKL